MKYTSDCTMKSRGPNVSVLQLRSTSEPWTFTETNDEKLVLENENTNTFLMEYENFLKTYDRENHRFAYDARHLSPAKSKAASSTYSPLHSLSRSSTTASTNQSPVRKRINQRTPSSVYEDNGNLIQNGTGHRNDLHNPQFIMKSSRSMSSDNGIDKRVGLNGKCRSYFNYPIISPPPGFQDDVLMNGNTEHHPVAQSSPRLYGPSSSRFGKYSLDEGVLKNYDFYERDAESPSRYRRKGDELDFKGLNYKSDTECDARTVIYPSRRNQLIDNYNNSISAYRPSPYHRFDRNVTDPSTDREQQMHRAVKSCSDYINRDKDVALCKWCNSSIVPKRSFSAGSSQHYYECYCCYQCGVTLSPEAEISANGYGGAERRVAARRNVLPEPSKVRRSASFQSRQTNPQFNNGYGYDTLNWRNRSRSRGKPVYMTFNDQFDELQIGNAIQSYSTDADYYTDDCMDDEDDDEIFYDPDNKMQTCTCVSTNATSNGILDGMSNDNIRISKPRSKSDRYKERYPTTQTEICEILNPPDIANVQSSMDSGLDHNYIHRDVDFIRKQPDILQNTYYGNRASSVCSENIGSKNYLFPSASMYEKQKQVEKLRQKSCSLPKSFQRHDDYAEDLKLCNNPTLYFHWKKYGFRGLFLNRRAITSSIMSETAPVTPVRDMPEKKKYGRLMKVGQYSSSPALDDDSMKHINFDCDTKYKKDRFKTNNLATLNPNGFRPSSQENIISGDGVFHKFCKSFSLRFLKKTADHEVDGILKNYDSSPCTESKTMNESDRTQLTRLGPSVWRSSSERNRGINIPNSKCKLETNQICTHPRAEPKDMAAKVETQQRVVRRTLSDLNQYSTGVSKKPLNPTVPSKHKAPVPAVARKYKQCSLRRSASQPLLNIKHLPAIQKSTPPLRTTCSEDERALFSEDDMMSDSGGSSLPSCKNSLEKGINEDVVIFAEAVWDHVAIESEELPFRAGDVIEVYNVLDREWWWGMCNGKSGWFPSDFVRLRVNQEESLQSRRSESPTKQNTSLSSMTNEQVRSKIISELLNTERDFVKILNDVKEAFITACQNTEGLFTEEQIYKIFGNWQQILVIQTMFLENLEANFNEQYPHQTCVGECFLKFREHFCIYSDYCNNHPLSIATLQQLYQKEEYKNFFEKCRAKKNLIAIPLDGFLLTPIQRICKYPLQLAELLKHTEAEHDDHNTVKDALNAMREVAILINERKRRMESLEKLILWQQRVEGWDGNNLIENSSQLIHQNDVTKVFAGMWTTNVTLFLFDHQLVFCKKDILKRDFFVYKGRISLDGCEIIDIPDGKDALLGINIRNGLRIQNIEKNKWLLFCCRTQKEKGEWINAFHKEKELVQLDERNKLQITPMDRQLAYITATTCNNRHAFLKHKSKKFKRSINHSTQFRNPASSHILSRKVGTWFMFGANRKNHRRFVSKNHSNAI